MEFEIILLSTKAHSNVVLKHNEMERTVQPESDVTEL